MTRFVLAVLSLLLAPVLLHAQPTKTRTIKPVLTASPAPAPLPDEVCGAPSYLVPDSALMQKPKRPQHVDGEPEEFIPDGVMAEYDPRELLDGLRYPPGAIQDSLEGTVVLKLLVEKDGSISRIRVEQATDPVFIQPAVDAVRVLHLTPGSLHGEAIRSWLMVPIKFDLR